MKRRNFILGLAGGLAGLLYLNTPEGTERSAVGSIEDQLKTLFSNSDNAREVGQIYLQANPQHAKRSYLEHQVGLNGPLGPVESFEAKREQDFLIGNTVILDGWVLAKAEVCVCALLALTAV